jgi:hypothetical protein
METRHHLLLTKLLSPPLCVDLLMFNLLVHNQPAVLVEMMQQYC